MSTGNDIRCALHALARPGARKPAPFVLAGISVCEKHLVQASILLEEGSVGQVLAAARQGDL